MPFTVASVPTTKTVIETKGRIGKRERLKIVFDDGAVLYFKLAERSTWRDEFILDIELTDLELVDEILLPKRHDLENNGDFDIFSLITLEQYRQLLVACLEPNRESDSPQIGEELSVWIGSRLQGGRGGGPIRRGHFITEITSIKLGPKTAKPRVA